MNNVEILLMAGGRSIAFLTTAVPCLEHNGTEGIVLLGCFILYFVFWHCGLNEFSINFTSGASGI